MTRERARWLLKRLRCMTPPEIGYRMGQAALKMVARRGWTRAAPASAPVRAPTPARPAMAPAERAALLAECARIRAGRVMLFGAWYE